jgi:hypothetical protein
MGVRNCPTDGISPGRGGGGWSVVYTNSARSEYVHSASSMRSHRVPAGSWAAVLVLSLLIQSAPEQGSDCMDQEGREGVWSDFSLNRELQVWAEHIRANGGQFVEHRTEQPTQHLRTTTQEPASKCSQSATETCCGTTLLDNFTREV